ncbi:AI-2E family transporter, partial [Patescibacteria group bacterium]|nr:AI-2E family transporter [Patescibacteria group bacterium]
LDPLVTIIAVLLGARLGGVIGMLMAVPFATIFSIVLEDIFAKSR